MSVGYQRHPRDDSRAASRCARERNEIDVVKIDGPFAHLANRWRFRDVPGGSEVHFYIDYAFASRMLAVLMGAVFDKAVRKYTEAFEARARALYGAARDQARRAASVWPSRRCGRWRAQAPCRARASR